MNILRDINIYIGIILRDYIAESCCVIILRDHITELYYGIILFDYITQICYGRYITPDILQQIYYGRYIMADVLRQVYIYIYILLQIYYGRYITAHRLRQIHYARYIASNNKKPYLNKFTAPEALDCCSLTCLWQPIASRTPLDCSIYKNAAKLKNASRTPPWRKGRMA